MNESLSSAENKEDLMEWIEPEIHELEVGQTSGFIGHGGDGGGTFPPDCSAS